MSQLLGINRGAIVSVIRAVGNFGPSKAVTQRPRDILFTPPTRIALRSPSAFGTQIQELIDPEIISTPRLAAGLLSLDLSKFSPFRRGEFQTPLELDSKIKRGDRIVFIPKELDGVSPEIIFRDFVEIVPDQLQMLGII